MPYISVSWGERMGSCWIILSYDGVQGRVSLEVLVHSGDGEILSRICYWIIYLKSLCSSSYQLQKVMAPLPSSLFPLLKISPLFSLLSSLCHYKLMPPPQIKEGRVLWMKLEVPLALVTRPGVQSIFQEIAIKIGMRGRGEGQETERRGRAEQEDEISL